MNCYRWKVPEMKKLLGLFGIAATVSFYVGCKREVVFEFEPNMVYSHALEIDSGYAMAPALKETEVAVLEFFGTPDEPKLPEFILEHEKHSKLVSMDNLQKAAGAPVEAGRGLYRQHCATCHGIAGNGRGETAALLDPYPRDYRLGRFKFKSTTRGAKPLREDLAYSIKHGIDGTSMKVIPELTDQDIDALVDYVIFLSWRGEFERYMLMEGNDVEFAIDGEEAEIDEETGKPEEGEHLYDKDSQGFDEQFATAQQFVTDIADAWLEAPEMVKEVPEPDGIPVPETTEEVLAAASSLEPSPVKESIAKGKTIFASELSACAKCHGPEGYGDGPTIDYDDWTKDWTLRINIDPKDEAAQVPLIARGALPPRAIVPRDFREGLYRGGGSPEQLYRRIAAGIDGTPMPAASIDANEIWHLVNYIRSLAVPVDEADAANETDIAGN